MPNENAESPLARLRDRLYAPKDVDGIAAAPLSQFTPKKPEGWAPGPEVPQKRPPRFSAPALFLMFAVGFFALAGIVAGTVLFLGARSVSGDHLVITVEGPTAVSGGESVPLLITIKNGNPTAIKGAKLEVTFPDGTFTSEDGAEPLPTLVEDLGDVAAGASVNRTVHAAFFGEENAKISIPITVEYTTEKSSATFVSKKSYDLIISTAPVTLSVDTLSETPSGQPLSLRLRVRSNAVASIENVAVKSDYPFGFSPTKTSLVPQNSFFVLGTLKPGEEKQIDIEGPLTGLAGEERVFHFSVGTLRDATASDFGVAYGSKDATVSITEPFLAVALDINRETADTVIVHSGALISALISWQNTLRFPVQDGRLSVTISGDAFDPASVKATGAFYRSSDRTILIDQSTNTGLKNLAPGDGSSGSFLFGTKTGSAMNALRNPTITLSVSASGRRIGEDKVPETLTSTLKRTIKIATDLTVAARAVRTTGPFTNTGPWPPSVDQKTTYTILLSARNTVNSVADAVVTTTLPPYVRFTGQVQPAGSLSFDEPSRTVTWTVGELAAGAVKEAAFQVELLPSTSQKGTSPELTSAIVISGFDRFVQQEVTAKQSEIDTQAESDPGYTTDKGTVK